MHGSVKEFFILMLVLETAMIGVFVALDLFLFYFFWEATLIPMALIIGIFGHGRRIYAAVKFFLYTMIASVFMLAALIWLYAHTGSFDFVTIQQAIQSGQVPGFAAAANWLFLGFFVAFAVKVPLFPLHTWLPDAHVEAPTAGSVMLAGVLLKMGTYGLLRFNVGLFPEQARHHAWWISFWPSSASFLARWSRWCSRTSSDWSPTPRSATLASSCWASSASRRLASTARSTRC